MPGEQELETAVGAAAKVGLSNALPQNGSTTCHEAAISWLIAGQVLTLDQFNKFMAGVLGPKPATYAKLLASKLDTRVLKSTARNQLNRPGLIVGFHYKQGLAGMTSLSHSMVTCDVGILAGFNNLNVGGGLDYTQIDVDNLTWNGDGSGVGPDGYEVYFTTVKLFRNRFDELRAPSFA
jgi:hypothetical protein